MRQSSIACVTYYQPRKLTIVFCDTYCELLKTVNISYHLFPLLCNADKLRGEQKRSIPLMTLRITINLLIMFI